MDSRNISLISVVALVAGILLTLVAFFVSATGGPVFWFVLGVIVLIAGIVLSALDMRGYFGNFVPRPKPQPKQQKSERKGSKR